MRPAPFLVFLSLFAAGTAMAAPQAAPAPRHPARPADPAAPRPSEVVSEDQLFARLAKAESREDAKPIEEKLEAMFRASGSPSVDLLMNRAEVAAAADDKAMARTLLESVTTIAPKFAEGWHARAALAPDGDGPRAGRGDVLRLQHGRRLLVRGGADGVAAVGRA